MLYVYGRLLFSRGVSLAPKLLLIGTLIYGAVRGDLVPDTRMSGRIEDIILIVIATRAFIYACPEELVSRYAQRAVGFRRRIAELQRAVALTARGAPARANCRRCRRARAAADSPRRPAGARPCARDRRERAPSSNAPAPSRGA